MSQQLYKIRIKKGDTIMVRSGKYKGRTGKVLATHPKDNKVTVEGINVVKRHRKPTQLRPQGGIEEITKPIWVRSLRELATKLTLKEVRFAYLKQVGRRLSNGYCY
jgi:large subunit ribosomal protein L24